MLTATKKFPKKAGTHWNQLNNAPVIQQIFDSVLAGKGEAKTMQQQEATIHQNICRVKNEAPKITPKRFSINKKKHRITWSQNQKTSKTPSKTNKKDHDNFGTEPELRHTISNRQSKH